MVRIRDARRFRRAVRAVYRALARQENERKPADLLGRWALSSGATFAVYRIDPPDRLALCGNGRERWHVSVAQLMGLLERGQLRFLGRIR